MTTTMRMLGGVALTLGLVAAGGFTYLADHATGAKMTESAQAFLETLSDEQRSQTLLPYDSEKRVDWHFIPMATRKGLPLNQMNDQQRKAAHGLLQAALSESGYKKTEQIMALESILRRMEQDTTGRRDPLKYYVTLFGPPAAEGTWGLSFEGHHLSLNFVVENNAVRSVTPHMLGSNPNELGGAGRGEHKPVLGPEESLAFELLGSLEGDARSQAIVADRAPRDVQAAGEAQLPQQETQGVAAGDLNDEQKKLLRSLIGTYLGNVPSDVAEAAWKDIHGGGFDKVRFAWLGATKPGVGHCYRVIGSTFMIELVNVQADAQGNPANHIHAVWRDPRGDFAIAR